MTILLWFAAGLAAGWALRPTPGRLLAVERSSFLAVFAVVAAQGVWLGSDAGFRAAWTQAAAHGALFAAVSATTAVTVTELVHRALHARRVTRTASNTAAAGAQTGLDRALLVRGLRSAATVTGCLTVSVLLGAAGERWLTGWSRFVVWPLNLLLLLIGFDSGLRRAALRAQARQSIDALWIAACVLAAAAVAASLLAYALPFSWQVVLASTAGCGFYSVTSGLVAAQAGPQAGAVALIGNLLREALAMCVIGILPAARLSASAAVALGGATAMDSTLPFLAKAYGPRASMLGIGSGLILSLLVPVLVPLILALR